MAFKSVQEFTEDRYHNLFRIINDGGTADVVFLYQSKADMLVADVHYVKSANYSGYVHCTGAGCPACKKNIRVQTKLFIPVYNIATGAIEFWDRNMNQGFLAQLDRDVFDKFPNPSEYVFRITRHGGYRDQQTRYDIEAVGRNSSTPYSQILAKFNATMPEYYENIVKSVSVSELTEMLQTSGTDSNSAIPDYVPVPRAGYQSSIPNTYVNASEAVGGTPDVTFDASDVEEDVGDFDEGDSGESGDTTLPTPIF